MSHKRGESLRFQSMKRLKAMLRINAPGEKIHSKAALKRAAAKRYETRYGWMRRTGEKPPVTKAEYINDALRDYIFSTGTYKNYVKHINIFLDYCRRQYKCRTLEECQAHAAEWLQSRADQGLSAYTVKLEISALAKLYRVPGKAFGVEVHRRREDITRSRRETEGDKHFSEEKHAELVAFCRSTGLRRSELSRLKPEQLSTNAEGKPVLIVKGKGGRVREAVIIGDVSAVVARILSTPRGKKVWKKLPAKMDIHAYRAEYACQYYKMIARDPATLPKAERYACKGSMRGVVFDRAAMLKVSESLGHSRVNVMASHYLYRL